MKTAPYYDRGYFKSFWSETKITRSPLARDLSPLRYPGGKGSLKYFLASVVKENNLTECHFLEAFCGGAGGSLPLLDAGLISHLTLNDANPAISSFWQMVFFHTNELLSLLLSTPITIDQWHRWKEVISNPTEASPLELAFSVLFMNRCNRSGLLYGGPIGGLRQNGPYALDCRFNRETLSERIKRLGRLRDRVTVLCLDARDCIRRLSPSENTIIYLDPPYVKQGKNLYRRYSFTEGEHVALARFLQNAPLKWLVSYDDDPLIHQLYSERERGVIELSYLMHRTSIERELIIASPLCRLPGGGRPTTASSERESITPSEKLAALG